VLFGLWHMAYPLQAPRDGAISTLCRAVTTVVAVLSQYVSRGISAYRKLALWLDHTQFRVR
jgi:hypothetical protein